MGPIETGSGLALILLTAVLGSWHCAGMCGPVALLMGKGRGAALYQSGRALGYAILGAIAGAVGDQILFRLQNLQHTGLRFAVAVVAALLLGISAMRMLGPVRDRAATWVRRVPSALRPLGMGLATAAFPCGWLWTFVAAAAATGSALSGAVVMLALWLGGLPALTAFAGLRPFLWRYFPPAYRRVMVVLLWIASLTGLLGHLLLPHS